MKIWGEKLSVVIIATLSVTLVFCFDWWFGLVPHDREDWFVTPLWFIITIGSATFWTLLSRSTMGGFALTFIQSFFIVLCGLVVRSKLGKTLASESIVAFAIVCYAGVMLWLGRRKLAQFQVTGGLAGDDLLMAGPNVMPAALAGLFRCRPDGAFLNLIRKELRLLRPLWLLTLLFVLCVTGLRITSWFIPYATATRLVLSLMLTVAMVLPVLAGSLSLGEERTSGRQSWHMAQPVSVRRQWLIKLVMAMFAGFICAAVVAGAAGQLGSPFGIGASFEVPFLVILSLLCFAAFWCASAFNGTVRAVLWVFPAVGALSLSSRFGTSLGELTAAGTLIDPVLRIPDGPAAVVWLIVPTLLLAVIQSYRLFRTDPQDSIRSVIRYLMPLTIVAFLCGFSLRVFELG
jgi:hypothetical protein